MGRKKDWARDMLADGNKKFRSGQFETAENLYEQAMILNPGSRHIIANLGITKIRLGKTQEGIQILRVALEQDPNDMDCLFLLAEAYREVGDCKTAERYLMYVIETGADCLLEAHFALGCIYFDNGHMGLAQDQFEIVLEMEENHVEAMTYLIWVLLSGQQYLMALTAINEILEIEPDNGTMKELQDKCLGMINWGVYTTQFDTSYCIPDHAPINRIPAVNHGQKPF